MEEHGVVAVISAHSAPSCPIRINGDDVCFGLVEAGKAVLQNLAAKLAWRAGEHRTAVAKLAQHLQFNRLWVILIEAKRRLRFRKVRVPGHEPSGALDQAVRSNDSIAGKDASNLGGTRPGVSGVSADTPRGFIRPDDDPFR